MFELTDDMYIAYAVRKQTPKNYKDYFDKRIHLIEVKNFGRAINPTKDIPNLIKDGGNGLLVEVDDTVGASEAVLRIHQEIELRDKLIAHGYEDVHRRFNARRVSEEHEALFEEMLK